MKYLLAFKLSFSEQFVYRLNFFIGRLRNIVILLLFYFLWVELTKDGRSVGGLSQQELIFYVFSIHIARAFIFGSHSRRIAQDINDGGFSTYLVRPVNHFWFFYFRELGERLVWTVTAVIEVVIIYFFIDLIPPSLSIPLFLCFLISLILAHILYYTMSYAMNLIAFWSREAMGPRFLFEWILEFSSGSFFPLTILGSAFFFLHVLPFAYILFIPMMISLGKIPAQALSDVLLIQVMWIICAGVVTRILWKRGLRRYTGEGI